MAAPFAFWARLRQLLPHTLRGRLKKLIDREVRRAREGQGAEIRAKMNSLTDVEMCQALYAASQAGVRIQLNVRGICVLRPGVPGLSENITVTSVVGRYLEHARIFIFDNGGEPEVAARPRDEGVLGTGVGGVLAHPLRSSTRPTFWNSLRSR